MPDTSWLKEDLALAVSAARRAAEAVAAQFRMSLEVRYKDPEQPVTAADLAADALLHESLIGARPGYGWLSEESAARPGEQGRTWMVDPIDGTNSFILGIPEFAVSVGLMADARPVLGVVVNPATGDVYTALTGVGAYRNGAPLRLRQGSPGRVLVVSRSEQARGLFAPFEEWTLLPCGSTAIKLCRVAEGAADAYVSFGPKRPWDLCAAELIVREAGGRVTDLAGGELRYEARPHAWRGLVACRPSLHDGLVRRAGGTLAQGSPGR
jgi:myo-inositol-1(or 4)-monophosphatase